jgi:hypothetical protein
MPWNHRILAYDEFENEDDHYFEIHEVYYNKDLDPISYTSKPISVGADTPEGLLWVLDKMRLAYDKPILSKSNFPKDYTPTKVKETKVTMNKDQEISTKAHSVIKDFVGDKTPTVKVLQEAISNSIIAYKILIKESGAKLHYRIKERLESYLEDKSIQGGINLKNKIYN